MKNSLAIIAALIMLFATAPYIIDIIKLKTKPNIVTWFTWTLLISIGAAALFASHQHNSALLLSGDALATFAVVLFGLKYGIAKLDAFDIFCQIGAITGLVLWLVFNSPIIAIVSTILIDFIGTIPTFRHSWRKPEEETLITFALGVAATFLTLLSISHYTVIAWIYPAYLLLSNLVIATIIIISRKQKTCSESA